MITHTCPWLSVQRHLSSWTMAWLTSVQTCPLGGVDWPHKSFRLPVSDGSPSCARLRQAVQGMLPQAVNLSRFNRQTGGTVAVGSRGKRHCQFHLPSCQRRRQTDTGNSQRRCDLKEVGSNPPIAKNGRPIEWSVRCWASEKKVLLESLLQSQHLIAETPYNLYESVAETSLSIAAQDHRSPITALPIP